MQASNGDTDDVLIICYVCQTPIDNEEIQRDERGEFRCRECRVRWRAPSTRRGGRR